jgi:PAS domain S-box-containing protein
VNNTDTSNDQLLAEVTALRRRVGELTEALETQRNERVALALEHELLQALMDNMPAQIYFKDRDGRFIKINQRQAMALGVSDPHDAIGKHDMDFFAGALVEAKSEDERHIIATGQPLLDKEEQQTLRGAGDRADVRWFSTTKAPIVTPDGTVVGIVGITRDITARRQAEELARQAAVHEELLRAQAVILDQLSTPLIPISDDVVVMPLIGTFDSRRANQMLHSLMDGVSRQRARVAILDITGVPLVDTQVASVIVQSARAAGLLGAQVVLTGVRPEVAQTLVGLGIDLSSVITRGTLQSGIAYALGRGSL